MFSNDVYVVSKNRANRFRLENMGLLAAPISEL